MPFKQCIEDGEHVLLLCQSFGIQQRDLVAGVLTLVQPYGLSNPSNKVVTQLLIYDSKDFPMKSIEISLS